MSPIVEKALKLVAICAVSAILLGVINGVTEPIIAERKVEGLEKALLAVLDEGRPGRRKALEGEGAVVARYPVRGADRWILELWGIGYGGGMLILASFTGDGQVVDVVLMDNQETPGLGKKAEKPEYMDKFRGTGGGTPVPVRKEGLEDPGSVTGATITFVGVAEALAEGSAYVKRQ